MKNENELKFKPTKEIKTFDGMLALAFNQTSLDESIVHFDPIAQFNTLREKLRKRKFAHLDEPSPRLINFWSEEFKVDDLPEWWRMCDTFDERYHFIKDVILSNKIELVVRAKNEGFFDQWCKSSRYFKRKKYGPPTLGHYAAMTGNLDIFVIVYKMDLSFLKEPILCLDYSGGSFLGYAVIHEDPKFVKAVLENITNQRDYFMMKFSESITRALSCAVNIKIMQIFLDFPRFYFFNNDEFASCFDEMLFRGAPLEHLQFLFLEHASPQLHPDGLFAIASRYTPYHVFKFKGVCYNDILVPAVKKDNDSWVRWLIETQGIDPKYEQSDWKNPKVADIIRQKKSKSQRPPARSWRVEESWLEADVILKECSPSHLLDERPRDCPGKH